MSTELTAEKTGHSHILLPAVILKQAIKIAYEHRKILEMDSRKLAGAVIGNASLAPFFKEGEQEAERKELLGRLREDLECLFGDDLELLGIDGAIQNFFAEKTVINILTKME